MTGESVRVQRFNALCALLFERLYENFPVGVDIGFTDIATDIKGLINLEAPDVADLNEVFCETVTWLEEESIIRFRGTTRDGAYHSVRLTMAGFAILGSTPTAVDGSSTQTVIDRIKEALGRSSQTISNEALKQSMGLVFRASTGI